MPTPYICNALYTLLIIVAIWSPAVATAQESTIRRFAWSTSQMGVRLNFVVYGKSRAEIEAALSAAVTRIQECNKIFSDYDETSEISRLSKQSMDQPVAASDELLYLLLRAREFSESTNGAFDVSLGSLTKLWRQARKSGRLPTKDALKIAKTRSGFGKFQIDQRRKTVQISHGLHFDFGGIAKGYAADQALAVLKQRGVSAAFVDLGGDIALGDPPPGKAGWHIAIAPLDQQSPVNRYIVVSRCGVATSGDTEQFVEIDGVRYSHIVDPKTGVGLQRRASITVIASDATTADALASAYSVMKVKDATEHAAEQSGVGFLAQEHAGGELKESATESFPVIQKTR